MFEPLSKILAGHASDASFTWLSDAVTRLRQAFEPRAFYYAFSGVSRHFDKQATITDVDPGLADQLQAGVSGFSVEGWDEFRLARVMLLLVLAEQDGDVYRRELQAVLDTADMREQVALYSAFALLPEKAFLVPLAREGTRTNIVDVFDAIALGNPFTASAFPEEAWNQMVLKVLFLGRPVYRVLGLEERANEELAKALNYLAHERWSAGRPVSPELWRCCAPHLDVIPVEDVERLASSDESRQREAAALLVSADSGARLASLRGRLVAELAAVDAGELSWPDLGARLATEGETAN